MNKSTLQVSIHKRFLDCLIGLSITDQTRVKSAINNILTEPESKGLRAHKVGYYISYSASMSLRVLAYKHDNNITIVHVDKHDDAYRWADRNKPVICNDQLIGIIETQNTDNCNNEIIKINKNQNSIIFRNLVAIGLGESFSNYIMSLDEDPLLDLLSKLSPEIQEIILSVLTKEEVANEVSCKPSDIYIIENDSNLEFALSLPEEKWRVFLHPKQKFAVEMPVDRHVLLRGGPGTGKTVTIVHRFMYLHKECAASDTKPLLITLNGTTRDIILSNLEMMYRNDLAKQVLTVSDFIKSYKSNNEIFQNYSTILIDEGQDIPDEYITILKENHSKLPYHFIALDANQSIINHNSSMLTNSVFDEYETISLRYSYRTTMQNTETSKQLLNIMHGRFRGNGNHDNELMNSSRDKQTSKYFSPLAGPNVDFIKITDLHELNYRVRETLKEYDKIYGNNTSKAVVVISKKIQPGKILNSDIIKKYDVIKPHLAKGREYFAGVVIDFNDYAYTSLGINKLVIDHNDYNELSKLYVALTRFRDRVTCFYMNNRSPFTLLSGSTINQKTNSAPYSSN